VRSLILASASPRRRELLLQAGFAFEVRVTGVDETALEGEDAVALAVRLARGKAEAVASGADEVVVLGADTVVVAPTGELLGKPVDDRDAARMLQLLAGATHQVVTGVCVCGGRRSEIAAALTWVTFNTLSGEEIAAYVATGEPLGKAGAYAIQGCGARFIPRIHGDYTNVVGLPLALVATMLAGAGVFPS
jgi:septum formation protein